VPSSSITDTVTGWSYDLSDWVERTGSVRIALVLVVGLAAVALALHGTRRQGASRSTSQPEGRVSSRR
jgi:hypothetical protein